MEGGCYYGYELRPGANAISKESSVPIYRQLKEIIKQKIEQGEFCAETGRSPTRLSVVKAREIGQALIS